jgi:hypothetical protein
VRMMKVAIRVMNRSDAEHGVWNEKPKTTDN